MRALLLSIFLISLPSVGENLSDGFPDGQYAGVGSWRDDQQAKGGYTALVGFADNNMLLEYQLESRKVSTQLSLLFGENGNFQVAYDGKLVGKGDCLADRCEYQFTIGDATYYETITLKSGKLKKVGYRQASGRTIYWEEVLYRLDTLSPLCIPIPGFPDLPLLPDRRCIPGEPCPPWRTDIDF